MIASVNNLDEEKNAVEKRAGSILPIIVRQMGKDCCRPKQKTRKKTSRQANFLEIQFAPGLPPDTPTAL